MKVEITTTLGPITVELNQDKAPKTVENFLGYVKSGFYDGTIFHRVISGFMIQGGGMDKDMKTKATNSSIENEASNGLSNLDGSIAMARTSDPHSATAQFFINTEDNPGLDFQSETEQGWGYCVFGEVVDGMEVVTKIDDVPTTSRNGHQDVPEEVIQIETVKILD
ncbi:MAG: cyclophilin [Legionellales bacterium]|jgi:peptidyl-prolyl cis-trans isomerase B (cyclophilin B)|nr:cyclophilin [Legionellales bacterium]|tara:strand:+ start:752 stop:1249 length:498 start_codon:yes stop_codon:yes gene_type:complete